MQQTIKSLLIDPNPTSALNEEAGKLLLEDYPAYCAHAKLYTEVHAMKAKVKLKMSPQKPELVKSHQQQEKRTKNGLASNVIPLSASHAQNAPTPEPDTKPRIFSLRIGVKRADEDGENRPTTKSSKVRRAGKGDLRRL
jgi:hypothetical protein